MHNKSPTMDEPTEQPTRSRSNTVSSSKEKPRPKSRGSTTSLQSVGVGNAFQPSPPLQPAPMPMNQNQVYPQPQNQMYGYAPDMMMQQNGMQPIQPHPGLAHTRTMSQHDVRPTSQHGFQPVQPYPQQFHTHMPGHWNMQPPPHMQHIRHASEQYEGSPAPEDSNDGGRRKKSAANTLANDQELRRLLAQYSHKTLDEVANEVQRNEGTGGKSEKAKQVFAMLWLRDSCSRSTQSVRRDRVFAKYTVRCGDMRVPTLNPASFGKLVRIIFPNVQTRRLGVRGESKYHYVDMCLNDTDAEGQPTFDSQITTGDDLASRRESMVGARPFSNSQSERPGSRTAMETADFPAPRTRQHTSGAEIENDAPPEPEIVYEPKLDCKYTNTTTIRLPVRHTNSSLLNALPSVRAGMPGTLSTYVAMPDNFSLSPPQTSAQHSSLELPEIVPYLSGETYDDSMAQALFHLYRSYCIDVIDAFRKCKEKPFWQHHTAFNGKMTVPISKIFNLPCLAPWIKECDMRMYKQMVRFIAPLALQNVPEMVWITFEHISSKLVNHLITTFEEKNPLHVVTAKAVPAARFTNLLKKLKEANAATLQLNSMLDDPSSRTQMWLDLMVAVEPDRLLDDSMPPPECFVAVQCILKHDMRALIEPVYSHDFVRQAEEDPGSSYAQFLLDVNPEDPIHPPGVLDPTAPRGGLLEKWITWLESLPQAFAGHHPQCMMDWHTKFWRSIMMQVGMGGSKSYQSWWFAEAFALQMLAWMCEMQGLLASEETQKGWDKLEEEKKAEAMTYSQVWRGVKRKRNFEQDEEAIEDERPAKISRPASPNEQSQQRSAPSQEPTLPEMPEHATQDEDTDAEFEEITRGGPLDLPSIHTGLTSPVKLAPTQGLTLNLNSPHKTMAKHNLRRSGAHEGMIDDSGIDMLDGSTMHEGDVTEGIKEAKKFNKRDWFLSSDPVDGAAGAGGVGLGIAA